MSDLIEFNYIGGSQYYDFIPGIYLIKLSGAQGGSGLEDGNIVKHGGYGAKVSIVLSFYKNVRLYFYVGSKGENGDPNNHTTAKGGWNGGGNGGPDNDNDGAGGGGGSTDIRIINKTDDEGIKSRIAVAAGGSGSAYCSYGAPGGDLYIYKMTEIEKENGYSKIVEKPSLSNFPLFKGENGRYSERTPSSGAGGGYYGGITVDGGNGEELPRVGTGGSSYAAGCNGYDNVVEKISELGIRVLNWTATPGHPTTGRQGNGLATVQYLGDWACNRPTKGRNSFLRFLVNLFLLLLY